MIFSENALFASKCKKPNNIVRDRCPTIRRSAIRVGYPRRQSILRFFRNLSITTFQASGHIDMRAQPRRIPPMPPKKPEFGRSQPGFAPSEGHAHFNRMTFRTSLIPAPLTLMK
jgi:hypothetical protein